MKPVLLRPLLGLGLSLTLTACGSASKDIQPLAGQLDGQLKGCVDQRLNEAMNTPEGRRDPLAAAQAQFEAATSACGLTGAQLELYLAYTNVPMGVYPDSVESTSIQPRESVLRISDQVIATALEVFANGSVNIRLPQGYDTVESASNLSLQVQRRGGAYSSSQVIRKSDKVIARVDRVFANGSVQIRLPQGYSTVQKISDLSPRVACHQRICEDRRVLRKSDRAIVSVQRVFADGSVEIRVPAGWSTVVSASDLAEQL